MSIHRREFVGAGLAAAGSAFLPGASGAWAGANDRIRVAVLGQGGRGRDHMRRVAAVEGVEIATFCDPDQTLLDQKAGEFEKLGYKRPALQQDLRRVMEDKNIDAVTIATCNHWHALAAIWACQAGKHVYVEKPVCHDVFSGAQMVAASRKYDRLMQGGTQRRSNGHVRRVIQALHDGIIGDIYMARCIHYEKRESLGFKDAATPPATLDWDVWVGPSRMQPFNGNLHPYNWHWFWDFGNGELANNGVHYMDVARWGLGKTLPVKIYSAGGRFGYKDQGQTPNTQQVIFQYEDQTEMVVEIRGRYTNSEAGAGSSTAFYGSKGYMMADQRGHFRVFLEGRNTPEPELGSVEGQNGNEEAQHFGNFFEAVRAGKREMLHAEINETYLSTVHCLLGNISYRLKRELHFDPTTRRFKGDHEADAMLREKYRAPFTIPEIRA